jgi:hypothetical protein
MNRGTERPLHHRSSPVARRRGLMRWAGPLVSLRQAGPATGQETRSDQGGRGGTRTPDICLVSRVAEAAGCAARITTRATASVRSTSDHEPTRLASRSGTCVARASTACASCTPGRLSPSVSVLNVLVADSHPPVVVRCGSRRCRLVGLPCRLPSSLANRSPTPVRGPDTNHG